MQIADVTVVIVNWNGGPLLKECVNKLLEKGYTPQNISLEIGFKSGRQSNEAESSGVEFDGGGGE